jgi:hypothetical protein
MQQWFSKDKTFLEEAKRIGVAVAGRLVVQSG